MDQTTFPAPTVRLLKLTVADLPLDDHTNTTRTEWLNPQHIESAVPYITWHELDPVLWLELTLSSGIVRYNHIGPTSPATLTTATEQAIDRLLAP